MAGFATIFTPQGDGNQRYRLGKNQRLLDAGIRHDIYPARGRKLSVLPVEIRDRLTEIRHDIYPARGRKLVGLTLLTNARQIFATIFTPQGDGNYAPISRTQRIVHGNSPRYLPRKGTETQLSKNVSISP